MNASPALLGLLVLVAAGCGARRAGVEQDDEGAQAVKADASRPGPPPTAAKPLTAAECVALNKSQKRLIPAVEDENLDQPAPFCLNASDPRRIAELRCAIAARDLDALERCGPLTAQWVQVARDMPVESVDATDLIRTYRDNEMRGDAEYKNKRLAITGKVEAVAEDALGTPYVALRGRGRYQFFSVQCLFENADRNRLAKLSRGQRITVEGRVDGLMMNVLVRECRIRE